MRGGTHVGIGRRQVDTLLQRGLLPFLQSTIQLIDGDISTLRRCVSIAHPQDVIDDLKRDAEDQKVEKIQARRPIRYANPLDRDGQICERRP